MKAAARSSASPPISPIITIGSVWGSASNAASASMCVVPMTGSPPMPTADEKPMSRSSYIIWYVSVPDLLTSPIRPGGVMSAGMMPALDCPGEIRPGQFGPISRVFDPCDSVKNSAESLTGTPSVITTASGISASMASTTAPLVNLAGTKITVTLAPVASTASATEPKTGTLVESNSTVWPPLPGVTPPTIRVPEASIRAVCLRPSDPVMPWTMTRESALRKIDIGVLLCSRPGSGGDGLGGQLGGPGGRAVHGVHLLQPGKVGVGEDLPAQLRVVAVEADDDRLGDGLPAALQQRERLHDPVRDGVAGGDAAEDVDEHAPDLGVAQDDLQPVGHHLGAGAAADVEEVGRLRRPGELRAGVRDHVEGAHDQARAVPDDAHRTVELDVVQALGLGRRLQRVLRGDVGERRVLRVPE